MRPLTYLASPYSHAEPEVREGRYREACRVAAKLMAAGETVFAPIPHSHAIGLALDPGLANDFDFWMAQDLPILAACKYLKVLRLPGWEKSRGIAAEMQFAKTRGIETSFVDP